MTHRRSPRADAVPTPAGGRRALRLRVSGAVQGVGFRPFVHGLATELGLAGEVRNTAAGVEIELEGPETELANFTVRLVDDAPPLALIEDLHVEEAVPTGRRGFCIVPSTQGSRVETLVTADAATCPDCLRELFDPEDRRYRYPFINCTNCGPRYTITLSVPYDRPATTMAGFTMCPDCRREYTDPSDRRFHAQPNACPACGPRLTFLRPAAPSERLQGEAALAAAVRLLREGALLAVKGLGGYHLACDAADTAAVARLRARKHRDEKPFAVMAADLDTVRRYCFLSAPEAELLLSPRRPVVLLERLAAREAALADGVAPGVTTYGFLLPYTPLHHLLLRDCARPLVMTSGNLSDEPIAFRDDDAWARLGPLVDGFLTHDRPIHIRVDDSVVRAFRDRPYLLRRARGYAPLPVAFSGADREILAVGGHLKNTFCLTRGGRAFLSHHIGDLENLQTLRSLAEGVAHLQGLFALEPEVVVHDLHPDYLSTRFALDFARTRNLPTLAVQHHEAHVASVLADARYTGPVVGVAFDGAGFGPDGTVWGGEIFVGRAGDLHRAAHLETFPLPGGDAAAREPWRGAVVLLDHLRAAAGEDDAWLADCLRRLPAGDNLLARPWNAVLHMARRGVRSPLTSSVGRLFDAVSALLGLRHDVAYEGQAAILLETTAREAVRRRGLPRSRSEPAWLEAATPFAAGDALTLPIAPFVRGVLADLDAGVEKSEIALRFHHALAETAARTAAALADAHGCEAVGLSGGVFQNLLFLELACRSLEAAGLRVLVHRNVPANDGGLCLGQAETAAARLRAGRS